MRGCGCNGHPAFPTPSFIRRVEILSTVRARFAPRKTRTCVRIWLFENLRSLFRRPCVRRDPYAVSVVLEDAAQRLSRNNRGLWLWVPARASAFALRGYGGQVAWPGRR